MGFTSMGFTPNKQLGFTPMGFTPMGFTPMGFTPNKQLGFTFSWDLLSAGIYSKQAAGIYSNGIYSNGIYSNGIYSNGIYSKQAPGNDFLNTNTAYKSLNRPPRASSSHIRSFCIRSAILGLKCSKCLLRADSSLRTGLCTVVRLYQLMHYSAVKKVVRGNFL